MTNNDATAANLDSDLDTDMSDLADDITSQIDDNEFDMAHDLILMYAHDLTQADVTDIMNVANAAACVAPSAVAAIRDALVAHTPHTV